MAASATLPLLGSAVRAQQPGLRAVILSDLHSAYERMGQVLAAVAEEVAAAPDATIILINGDVFEAGNVAANRSAGAVDWHFLEKLAALAPTVLNIGNHEADFDNDLKNVVAQAEDLGITVVSNIIDSRTGAAYAPASTTLELAGQPVTVTGIATAAINTYPAATREMMTIPDPAEWATENLPGMLQSDAINIVLSHAGVVADRAILPLLPDATLLIGGHDHLRLVHAEGATRYVHTGSWSDMITVASLPGPGAAPQLTQLAIARDATPDAELAAQIEAVLAEHLTDEERASIGTMETAMSLGETGRYVAEEIAKAAGADVGFIGHTSFGTGFPAGPVSLYDYNSILRFEGKIVTAEVDAATLAAILDRTNQDGDIPLADRTGDFLYAAPTGLPEKATYIIAGNDWSFINQKAYFGREDLEFTAIDGLMLKPMIRDTLAD
ncbi:metallophosphoesterase [Devosia sp.]|uniref:metallophosphoesterase n=1 Tax=Devosia sp. TaxID=1871048 RepID=UPI003A91317B